MRLVDLQLHATHCARVRPDRPVQRQMRSSTVRLGRVIANAEPQSRRRLASKLFETYKDQMVSSEDETDVDGSESEGETAVAATTTKTKTTMTQKRERRAGGGGGRTSPRRAGRQMAVAPAPASSYTVGKQENEIKRSKYFYMREDGSMRPVTGVHGGGERRWWALRVTIGREKQTCTNIERRYQQLREAAEVEGTADSLQEIETWDVWKRVRAWSPKTEKMGNKMVRYEGGGWVLVQAVLTEDIASIIKGNINILGYHHREVFEGEEFPIPADSELVASLAAWQEDLTAITEDDVREELGLGPKREVEDSFDDFEDYGRGRERGGRDGGRGRGRDRDGDRGGYRDGDGSRGGLFSSSQGSDGWDQDDGASSWYGGGSGEDEGLLLDTFDEPVGFGSTLENQDDAVNEFGAWLGDFGAGDDGGDWMMGAATEYEAKDETKDARSLRSSATSSPTRSNDDLSWWDDDNDDDEDNDEDKEEDKATTGGGLFTDHEPTSSWSSSTDEVRGDADADADADSHSDAGGSGSPRIAVVAGEFKDFEGRVLAEEGDGVVKVEVDVFGLPTVVEIRREDVEFL